MGDSGEDMPGPGAYVGSVGTTQIARHKHAFEPSFLELKESYHTAISATPAPGTLAWQILLAMSSNAF